MGDPFPATRPISRTGISRRASTACGRSNGRSKNPRSGRGPPPPSESPDRSGWTQEPSRSASPPLRRPGRPPWVGDERIAMSIQDRVAIIGVGATQFGEHFEQGYSDLIVEAAYEAFRDANVSPPPIQAAWLGTCFPDSGGYQGNAGASLADALSLYHAPISRVANYCATGADAFRNACFAVAAGAYDLVLVVGAEKMRDVTAPESLGGQLAETGHPVHGKGVTAPGMFALFATRSFDRFGIGRETLAKVAMKKHRPRRLN